jgi:hypothetical protein
MLDINKDILTSINALIVVADTILGEATAGVTTGNGATIHLLDESELAQATANSILDNWSALTVTADSPVIDEGAGNVTITCNDVAIADDTEVGYVVLLDGELYDNGTDTVTGNSVSLILADPVDGTYEVYVYRLVDTFASGYAIITVNEVA